MTPTEWETRQWLKDSGLPDNSVTCLLQTRDRFLWVGTGAGLARFDGNQFEPVPDAGGRPFKITCLFEDPASLLWVGTQDRGLMIVTNHTLVAFQAQGTFRNEDITGIVEDRAGIFWVGTSRGLVRIHQGDTTRFTTADGLPDDYVSAIHSARSGALWVTTRQGICELRGSRFVRLEFQTQGLGTDPEFLGVYEDSNTNVWVFGDTFLVNLKDGKRLNNFPGGSLASYRIWSLSEARSGGLWISTSGQGLFAFAAGRFTPVAFREKMLSSDIRAIFEDDEGNIWLGTFGGGLIRLRQRACQFLAEGSGLPGEAASCVVASPDDRLFVGFLHGGLFTGKPGRFAVVDARSGFETENLVSSLAVASNLTVWVGTDGDGAYQLNDTAVQHWTTENGLADNSVTALGLDSRGWLWASSRSGALQCFKPGEPAAAWTTYPLAASPITALATAGRPVLAGTQDGEVFQNRGTNFQTVALPPPLQGKPIRALYQDSRGWLWIGADAAGLACVTPDGPRVFDDRRGFPDTSVQGMIEDPDHNLWVSTAKAIWLVPRNDLNGKGPLALHAQRVFNEATGLPNLVLSGGPAAAGAGGLLFFASGRGLIEVNPQRWFANNRPLQVTLQRVTLNNSPQPLPTEGEAGAGVLEPRARTYSLEFKFTAVSLGFAEQLRFEHYLEGFDSDWLDSGAERTVHYGRLPPGNYRFHVRVARNDNDWSEMPRPYVFQLEPPAWLSLGAMVLYALGGMGVIALLVRRISLRQLQGKMALLAQQQAMERERMRIAQNMHDDLGSKLARISLLSELALGGKEPPAENIRSIATTSRKLLQTLDEIVWAVNPQNDTIESAAAYLAQYADEYFRHTQLPLELRIPTDLPHLPISSETRHNLFLAYEEALGNVLKHSSAPKVSIEMLLQDGAFSIVIRDNGRGFAPGVTPADGHRHQGNGLANMRKRLAIIGGECQIESVPGCGTTVILRLPLSPKLNHLP